MRHKLTRRGTVAALALLGVLAAVGVGYGAIPSTDSGVIHSCYNTGSNPSGQLRVIDTDAGIKCSKNEKSLNFNQLGPQGPKGDQGIQGLQGLKGDQGIQGLKGDQGIQGVKGDTGDAGTPGLSTATFAGSGQVNLTEAFTKVASKTLPAGSWALIATVNTTAFANNGPTGDSITDASCQLRSGAAVVGGTTDRRLIPGGDSIKRSLSMNGGAQIAAGGGEVSLWCNANGGLESVDDSKLMMIQLGGFS